PAHAAHGETMTLSRRSLLQTAAAAPLAAQIPGPRPEGRTTPKICLEANLSDSGPTPADPAEAQTAAAPRIPQLGVEHVISGGPRIPWTEATLGERMESLKTNGLTLGNLMISGFNRAIYNRPGRDEDIANVIASVKAAGKVGLPVVEYNWYAHRAMEGYFAETGRAGAGWTGFDYARMKDLPPLENEGVHTLDEMWANIAYFLKAVIPEAEKAGVRLALHPNDPPAPLSRGSQQIMATLAGWKKLISIVNSPSNGITFDCGVTRELGEDPIEVCRSFAPRDPTT